MRTPADHYAAAEVGGHATCGASYDACVRSTYVAEAQKRENIKRFEFFMFLFNYRRTLLRNPHCIELKPLPSSKQHYSSIITADRANAPSVPPFG